ncbi:MAG: nucleotidyltransferase domain-containing protein [Chitinispirillaceae bacterium]|nr:nucleotidyltransferase domain-containing protein [Chitinispirillaceae bacterium]
MQKTRFLDKEPVVARLRDIAESLRSRDPNILQIVLFGSLADDTYTPSSDADIIILLKSSSKRPLDRIGEYLGRFIDAPVPVDVFPYTEEEAARVEFARRAIEHGVVLA